MKTLHLIFRRPIRRPIRLLFLLLLMSSLLLSSCANPADDKDGETSDIAAADNNGGDTADDIADDTMDNDASNAVANLINDGIKIIMPEGSDGVTLSDKVSPPVTSSVSAASKHPSVIPIYKATYPYNFEGPMFEVTEEMRSTMKSDLYDFLCLLYPGFTAEQLNSYSLFDYDDGFIYTKNDNNYFGTSAGQIAIRTDEFALSLNSTDAELLQNTAVKAAMSYMGITNPLVSCTTTYENDGTIREQEYIIYDSDSDAQQQLLNRCFHFILVRIISDHNILSLTMCEDNTLVMYKDCPTVSYTAALNKAAEVVPAAKNSTVKAEILYNGTLSPGYFIPFYRFYIDDGTKSADGVSLYSVVDVTMIAKVQP